MTIKANFVRIGARSSVHRTQGRPARLPHCFLYVGNPARRSRELTPAEIARIPKMARDYVALKQDYVP